MIRRPPRSTLFPTRRSSDLAVHTNAAQKNVTNSVRTKAPRCRTKDDRSRYGQSPDPKGDRKSTRLNSSHGYISYAVFCLKKKTNRDIPPGRCRNTDPSIERV